MAATENDYPLWNSSQFTYPDPEPLRFSLQVSLTYPTCHHHSLTLSLHQVSLGWLQQFPSSLLPHLYYTPKQTSFKTRSLLTTKNNKTRQRFLFPLNNRNQLQSPNHGESSHSVLDWLQSTSVTHCFLCGHLLMYLMGVFCIWMLPHRLGPLHLPERCFSVLLCLCFPPFLPFSPYSFSHLMNSFYHKKYFNWHPHCEVFQFIFKVSHSILILPQPLLIIFMFIYNFWFMSVFLTQRQEPSFTLYHLQQHHRPRRLWTTSPEEMSTLLTSF